MKLAVAIDDVQACEMELAKRLVSTAERHHDDADVYHMSLARAHACAEHVQRLRPFAASYDVAAVDIEAATTPGLVDSLRQVASAGIGHTPASGLALLNDLGDVYVAAHRAEISWIVLQQAAKAARDEDLVAMIGPCAEEAEQTWKWLRTKIKEAAPEALAIG